MKNSQFKIMFLMLLLAAAAPLFAQDLVPSGLKSLATSVQEIFTGSIIKTILVCCLAGCAVAYGFNKDNEKMKRNIIAIAIAIAIVVGASFIVGKIWDASK
jgi:type IV secretory pathway VirB2 component (pilin)